MLNARLKAFKLCETMLIGDVHDHVASAKPMRYMSAPREDPKV